MKKRIIGWFRKTRKEELIEEAQNPGEIKKTGKEGVDLQEGKIIEGKQVQTVEGRE